MTMRHLFILDPLNEKTLEIDTTLQISYALFQHGHEIYFADTPDLATISGQQTSCRTRRVMFGKQAIDVSIEEQGIRRPLDDFFSAVHMRKDPPFNLGYLAATWQLDRVKTPVFNRPQALRQFNEKMAILAFPDYTAKSLVSRDCQLIIDFISEQLQGDAIVKPLVMYGGAGVFRLHNLPSSTIKELLSVAIDFYKTPLIVQQFMPQIFDGEVRAFCAFGEPVAWALKLPVAGQYLANTAHGATIKNYKPSTSELAEITTVAKQLLAQGIYFVGFDIIAGRITEINVTSPRLLLPANSEETPYESIAQLLANHLCHS